MPGAPGAAGENFFGHVLKKSFPKMSETCDKTIDFEGFWRGSPKSSFEKRVGGGGWVGVAIIF